MDLGLATFVTLVLLAGIASGLLGDWVGRRRMRQIVFVSAERVQVVRIEHGDCIVLSYPGRLGAEMREHLKATATEAFQGAKVVVLDGGVSLDVVRTVAA